MGRPNIANTDKSANQPPPENMEVNQDWPENVKGARGDKEVVPSTSLYVSLDSTDKESLRIYRFRKIISQTLTRRVVSLPWVHNTSGKRSIV